MKKFISALLTAFLISGLFSACTKDGASSDTTPDSNSDAVSSAADTTAADTTADTEGDTRMEGINEIKDWLGYMPELGEKTDSITVIQNFASDADKLLAESLQGITARTKPTLCTAGNNAEVWLKVIKAQLGDKITISYVNDVWAALDKFGDMVPRKEYVIYDADSINAACTIASAEGILIASVGNSGELQKLGYTQFADARGMTDADAIRQYKDKLNTFALVQQIPSNYALRDLGIAYGLGFYFYDDSNRKEVKESEEIHGYIDEGGIVFGWGPNDEYQQVKLKANHGLITIPSDHAWNLSIFSSMPREQLEQINDYAAGTEAVDGKHYVALLMTDGDNVQWMVNDFNNAKWFGSAERGSIPMAWMIPPTLLDLAPQTAKWLFLQQTDNDVFLNALSGTGYFYPTELTSGAFDKQIEKLSFYMNTCDFDAITIMDNSVPSKKLLEKYASIEKLKGGVLFTYPDYYKGAKGKIYWSGDKPFIAVRNSMWDVDADDFAKTVANDIKKLGYDITSPNAYSVIVVHCWSETYSDAVEFAKQLSKLDENVEFVRVDQLIKLVSDNVKH
jgi:hypothetical protein